jgi:polyprenyldihydroxybenzoate methyltransferase / 3-demethylubiquinol 3-O-methyltransferase
LTDPSSPAPATPTSSDQSESPPLQTLRYLDIGCGGGIFAESAARLPTTSSVTAIDPTLEIIQVAKSHARKDPSLAPPRLQYLNASIEQLHPPETPQNAYDVLTLFEVIEHVSSPSSFLTQCLQHVKPGGWIIGSTIARSWVSWLTTKVVAEDIVGIVPRGTHEWDKYINPDELVGWFRAREGWGEFKVTGVIYVPGLGWREVRGGEEWGNYFWGFRRDAG